MEVLSLSLAYKISRFNRKRKFDAFLEYFRPGPGTSILDAGFAELEFSSCENYLERHYHHPERITALGIDEPHSFCVRYPKVRPVRYNGDAFPFANKEFDIGWSNAVLEHVGGHEKQVEFLRELHRTCRKLYITTPNKHFPVEVHTRIPLLHILSKDLFEIVARLLGKDWATGDYMHLLTLKELKALLHEAGIDRYTIKQNKVCGFTLDFCVIAE